MADPIRMGGYRTLAEGIRDGDPASETEFAHSFSSRIFMMSLVRTGDREASRELAQDVLMAVMSALRDGHVEDIEKLPAFVHGTARNLINNYLRTRRRRPMEVPLSPEMDVASVDNQFDQLDRSERLSAVNRALRQLDSTDRDILLLTLVEGSKPGEVAQRLRLTSEVVRTRKLRALRKITEIVGRRMSRR